jgi:hypothetical protein
MAPLAWLLALPMHRGLMGEVLAVVIASLLSAGFLITRFAVLARRGPESFSRPAKPWPG